jgi:NAD(P)-dependent dehydrogenase (short-subunit alcohol dehydrogenase family)
MQWHPGPVHASLLARFTGNEERKGRDDSRDALKRAGKPEEIAQTIVFPSSGKPGFITSAIIAVDGKSAL